MNVFRAYRIGSFVTVLAGTTMYGVAEPRPEAALLALVLAFAAWVVTGGGDIARARREIVPRWAVSSAVVIATALMALAWMTETGFSITGDMENTVSRFSRYMLWLQVIKLFEAWRPRDQAQLLALSAMLVVGACLTSVTLAVGGLLLLYLPSLLWTVVLFQLNVANERSSGGMRTIVFRKGARRDLRRIVSIIGVITLVIGAGVFATMPRGLGEKMLGSVPEPDNEFKTGFSDTVQLGSAGLLSESRRIVGKVRIMHRGSVIGARRHLLRGAVLDEYDPEAKRWKMSQAQRQGVPSRADESSGDAIESHPSTMEVELRAIPTGHLFTILEPIGIDFAERTAYKNNPYAQTFERVSHDSTVQYTVSFTEPGLSGLRWDKPLGGPPEAFGDGPIHAEAMRTLDEFGIDHTSDQADVRNRIANALTTHLGRTCAYTLEMQSPGEGQDPIEMFLEIRKGHCEYFASALAAMCLSVGIDARVVTGFMTEEYDESQAKHIIRENHAHAWVEAEVYPGVWRSFDPSPREAIAAIRAPAPGIAGLLRRTMEMIDYAWIEAVVSYGESSRNNPKKALDNSMLGWLEQQLFQGTANLYGTGRNSPVLALAQRALVGLVAGLIAGAMTAAMMLVLREPIRAVCERIRWGVLPKCRVFNRGVSAPPPPRSEGAYHRAMSLLARCGCPRPAWRPALAHAIELEQEHAELGRALRGIVELYYAERFGCYPLSETSGVDPERLLKEFAACARDRKRAQKGNNKSVGR